MALNDTLIGEICHIKGEKPTSARYDPNQSPIERHAYENLILMCPTHHTVIDDDEVSYTVERLRQIKLEHEANATPVSETDASTVATTFFTQSVSNVGQTGGLSAYAVHANTITVQSAPTGNSLAQQRQMQAVQTLWKAILDLRREFGNVLLADSVLLPSEMNDYFRKHQPTPFMDALHEYADPITTFQKFNKAGGQTAANERPFVTHRVWSVFFILQAIYGRSSLLLGNSFKHKTYHDWHNDNGIDQLLRSVLPAHTVDHIKQLKTGGLQTAVEHLEYQFLTDAGMHQTK